MNMKMEITHETGYLHIKISGKFSLTEANDYFVKIMEAAAQYGVDRILLDCITLEGTMTTFQRFQYSSFVINQIDERRDTGVEKC